ncbi:hypothetical protein [Halalkalibacter alkaliphilus]|uniref:Uncharacterized protein n=1 Tax=Halalkalibacter alkaliphilus TaxID=2917993 RepID=A0A9X2CTU1_9BACI|nr:hypothetical protein [Halalkalibacter alkaliphilus]MCL7748196.1 hypothetical protein [Halalkalibacter alkaliphilus]
MHRKKAVIGIIIFAIVTILSFFLLQNVFQLGEGVSVIAALLLGGIVEFLYQKKG